MERKSMWSENEETDMEKQRAKRVREGSGGGCMNYDQRNYEYTLGQMLHKQPEDLSIPLRQFVHQAVDGQDARLWTFALC